MDVCVYTQPVVRLHRTESQLLEAWPASHYEHLRESADSADLGVAANSHFVFKEIELVVQLD